MADQPVPRAVDRPVPNRPALSVAVVEALTREIVTEQHAPGSALPPTSVLCERFAVSRTVVREAITSLTEKGLVASRQGWGTVVLDQSHWSLLDPMILEALFQREDRLRYLDNLIAIRTTLECSMVEAAARGAGEADRAELVEQLEAMEPLVATPERYAPQDVVFHELIHRISGDLFGRAIVASIQGKALSAPQYHGHPTSADVEVTHADHRRIVDAVLAGDAEAASAAMREHITASWARRRPHGD